MTSYFLAAVQIEIVTHLSLLGRRYQISAGLTMTVAGIAIVLLASSSGDTWHAAESEAE